MIELTGVAMFVMGGLTVGALFLLRRREPLTPRPYRATAYPVLPAFYLAVSAAVIGLKIFQVIMLARQPNAALSTWFPLLGIGLFLGILVVHLWWTRVSR